MLRRLGERSRSRAHHAARISSRTTTRSPSSSASRRRPTNVQGRAQPALPRRLRRARLRARAEPAQRARLPRQRRVLHGLPRARQAVDGHLLRAGGDPARRARAAPPCASSEVLVERAPRDGRRGPRRRALQRARRAALPGRARSAVVLAAGCMATPVLLQRSGNLANASGQVGENLQFHPGTSVIGVFPDPVDPIFGATQGYQSLHFLREGFKLETLWAPPGVLAVRMPGLGHRASSSSCSTCASRRSGTRSRAATARSAACASAAARWIRTCAGTSIPTTPRSSRRAVWTLAEIFFAAGARKILPGVAGHARRDALARRGARCCAREPPRARDMVCASTHVFCTTRMHGDPRRGVVDEDRPRHDLDNLYIVDTGVFPLSPSVNPMFTGMALARRSRARARGARLSRRTPAKRRARRMRRGVHPAPGPADRSRPHGRRLPGGAATGALLEERSGFLRLEVPMPARLCNPRGQLFGGFAPTYVDLIALFTFRAGRRREGPWHWLATVSMRLDYYEPVRRADLPGRERGPAPARPQRLGRDPLPGRPGHAADRRLDGPPRSRLSPRLEPPDAKQPDAETT